MERDDLFEPVLLDGHGKPWGRTPRPMVEDPQNWIPEFSPWGELLGYLRVRWEPPAPNTAQLADAQRLRK